METTIIITMLSGLLIPSRNLEIVSWYILSIMLPTDKHSQTFASKISGKISSLFSKLLYRHLELSEVTLNRAAKRRLKKLMKIRKKLTKNTPWTIALIIDATLHKRSSTKQDNVQKFNHGKGWIIGHQWTNIGIMINNQFIPFPPIPFYSRDYCNMNAKKGIRYLSEHKKLYSLLKDLDLKSYLGEHLASEVVVLMDSDYDDKKLLNIINKKGWNFTVSLKSSRVMKTIKNMSMTWRNIKNFFKDGRRKAKTIRIEVNGSKKIRRYYSVKQLVGVIKGVTPKVKLVWSKRSRDKNEKFLACSSININVHGILEIYSKRWQIELFHKDIKSYLGLEDAGVHKFEALHAHIHWVYITYILLCDLDLPKECGIKSRQTYIKNQIEISKTKNIIQLLSRFKGRDQVKKHCFEVIHKLEAG